MPSSRNITVHWHVGAFQNALFSELRNRIQIVGHYLKNKTQENVSVLVDMDSRGNVTQRSRPGEFPRMETGELRDSIKVDFENSGLNASVSVGAEHGIKLEVYKRWNRSFLVRTLQEEKQYIRSIMMKPLSGTRFR